MFLYISEGWTWSVIRTYRRMIYWFMHLQPTSRLEERNDKKLNPTDLSRYKYLHNESIIMWSQWSMKEDLLIIKCWSHVWSRSILQNLYNDWTHVGNEKSWNAIIVMMKRSSPCLNNVEVIVQLTQLLWF